MNGSFESQVDSIDPYTIGGQKFNKYFMLVDGIYPELEWFVKNIPVPIDDIEKNFSAWPELPRKDVEPGFAVLQSCFCQLSWLFKLWKTERYNP